MSAITPTQSCYIGIQNPERFGGPEASQRLWQESSAQIVQTSINQMHQGENPQTFFQNWLKFLGAERHRIAKETNTHDYEEFGQFCYTDKLGAHSFTPLITNGIYAKYHKEIHNQLEKTSFNQLGNKLTESREDISFHYKSRLGGLCPAGGYIEAHTNRFKLAPSVQDPTENNRLQAEDMLATAPDLYESVVMAETARMYFPSIGPWYTRYFIRTITMGTSPLGYVLIRILSKTDPYCALVQDNSPFTEVVQMPLAIGLVSQPSPWITQSLKVCAKRFEKILAWDRVDPSVLKTQIAELRYIFAFVCPFKRGSAAVGEWIEMALYGFHGYNVQYAKEGTVDLEALTAPSYSAYEERYNQLITIEATE